MVLDSVGGRTQQLQSGGRNVNSDAICCLSRALWSIRAGPCSGWLKKSRAECPRRSTYESVS